MNQAYVSLPILPLLGRIFHLRCQSYRVKLTSGPT